MTYIRVELVACTIEAQHEGPGGVRGRNARRRSRQGSRLGNRSAVSRSCRRRLCEGVRERVFRVGGRRWHRRRRGSQRSGWDVGKAQASSTGSRAVYMGILDGARKLRGFPDSCQLSSLSARFGRGLASVDVTRKAVQVAATLVQSRQCATVKMRE